MQELKANTAVDVLIGPFMDETTGKDVENGFTIEDEHVKLSKLGQALTAKNDANDAGNDADGYYNCPLNDTDTNQEGTLVLSCHFTGALPVRHEYMVLSEAAWDFKYAANDGDVVEVNVVQINDVATNLHMLMDETTTVAADDDLTAVVANASVLSHMMTPAADTSTYDASTDSLQALGADVDTLIAGVAVSSIGADVITPASVDEDADFTIQALSITNKLDAGSVEVDGTTTLTGAVALSSTLAIAGASTLASLSVTGQMDAGNLTIDNAVAVGTTTTLSGNVSCGGTFDVVGALTAGSLGIDANAVITGTTTFTGAVSMPAGLAAVITGSLSGAVGSVTGHIGQSGDSFAIVNGTHGLVSIQDDVDEILVDTAEIGSAVGASISADIAAVTTDTEDIQGRIPAALSGGNIKADALAISTSTDAADKLEANAEVIVIGRVSHDNTAASTVVFYSDTAASAVADHYNGRIVIFTSGDLTQQATDITDYEQVAGEGKFTVTALTSAPVDNVTFVIV